MAIADIRREYSAGELDRKSLDANALAQFQAWFAEASAHRRGSRWRQIGIALYKLGQAIIGQSPPDVNAMMLATVDMEGHPSARTVLLKGVEDRGFIFFTNYDSRKGRELAGNPHAALVFYWPELERQVCVAGTASRIPIAESEAYFKSRPKGSRLAAWASNQSEVIADRAALEAKWRAMEERFHNVEIPLPPNWGGYALAPSRIEFWQGRPNRLHDRFRYTRQPDGCWILERLAP